jgi:hypothetical protein
MILLKSMVLSFSLQMSHLRLHGPALPSSTAPTGEENYLSKQNCNNSPHARNSAFLYQALPKTARMLRRLPGIRTAENGRMDPEQQ